MTHATTTPAAPALMPLPDDETFAALLALATGAEMLLDPTTGRMLVVLDATPPGKACFIEGEHLDALFARGWIEADDERKTVTTTPRGAYWLNRWIDRQNRKKPR